MFQLWLTLTSIKLLAKNRKIGAVRQIGQLNVTMLALSCSVVHQALSSSSWVFTGSILSGTWIYHQAASATHTATHLMSLVFTSIKMQDPFICMKWKDEIITKQDQSKTHHGDSQVHAATHPRRRAHSAANLFMDEYENVWRIGR